MAAEHLVITVHGIRTFGEWQRRLEQLIKRESSDIEVAHFVYGYLPMLGFIIPFTRWLIVRRFRREVISYVRRSGFKKSTSWRIALEHILPQPMPIISTFFAGGWSNIDRPGADENGKRFEKAFLEKSWLQRKHQKRHLPHDPVAIRKSVGRPSERSP